ncbi:MAG: phosphatase PAP2 family protein [Candidatus Methylomirabilia bacterium]
MIRRIFISFSVLALCCACRLPVRADENILFSPDFFVRTAKDLVALPQKPLSWEKREWVIAGALVGGTLLAFTVDDPIRQHFFDHRSGFLTDLSSVTTHFGDWKQQVPIIGGLALTGLATGSDRINKMAADSAEASFIAAGIINPILVYVTGRALPNAHENAFEFRPFVPGRNSFASGHTAAAFALATSLDQNLREDWGYWQTPFLYAMATGCGVSRIYDEKHYLSDVILGAGIGAAVGFWIANRPRNRSRSTVTLIPTPDGVGLLYRF